MAPIVESVEISRSPDDVFAYVENPTKFPEWQASVVSVQMDPEKATGLGSRGSITRRGPGGARPVAFEVTEYDPPRRLAFRGPSGPIRANGNMTVEPTGDGSRSRLTLHLDFEGHGFGKLLVPLVRRQASQQVPKDYQTLKRRLEGQS